MVRRMAEITRVAVGILRRWRRRRRSRRELARIEPRILRDAGIHALDAHREAGKPFWRQ